MARPVEILLVEDSEGDVVLTREAFEEGKVAVNITDVGDGASALQLLEDREEDLPDLILLDLNLPGMDGHEVLRRIRNDDRFEHLPVIMLTSSRASDDVRAAYRAHVSSFISKPVDPSEFLEAVRTIESYWLTVVRLPNST